MLKNIHLKNLALIDECELELTKGLNILTGETGSGKSVVISSVNIALGSKANKSMIRTGAAFGLAELMFTGVSGRAFAMLDELGIEHETDEIQISRKITRDSSVCRVNGETITLSNLKRLSGFLVDVHGQHDNQSLLDPAKHILILDAAGKAEISDIKSSLSKELSRYKTLRREYSGYDMSKEELEREISLLEYEISEIDQAGLVPSEDTRLEEELRIMSLKEKAFKSASRLSALFEGTDGGIINSVSLALKEASAASRTDPSLCALKDSITDLDSLSKDISHDILSYLNENSFDTEAFLRLTERLSLINRLKSRYADTIEGILAYQSSCKDRLEKLEDAEKRKEGLSAELSASKARINSLSKELSAARKKTAKLLEGLIYENLKDLNFASCSFEISFKMADKISENGYDKVEFMISLNPGEPLKPLAQIASGGELSRIMLALKCSLASHDEIPTLIFDEIDTGISGYTASRVAEKLHELSKSHQVICITHLPQIACAKDSHFLIEKEAKGGQAVTAIRSLCEEESIKELARMISAGEITQPALEHAKAMRASFKDRPA